MTFLSVSFFFNVFGSTAEALILKVLSLSGQTAPIVRHLASKADFSFPAMAKSIQSLELTEGVTFHEVFIDLPERTVILLASMYVVSPLGERPNPAVSSIRSIPVTHFQNGTYWARRSFPAF
jgi:hypothetical protein